MAARLDLDVALAQSGASDVAALAHAELRSTIAAREAVALNRLVAEHRAGTLSDTQMRTSIAAIAEGRSILDDLARTMRLGQEARHRATQAPAGHSRAGV